MEALGLSEVAAEQLASTAGVATNGGLREAANPSTAGGAGELHLATAASHSSQHGDAPTERQAEGEDGGDDDGGPSLLDGLDALDPEYWDELPSQSVVGSQHNGKPSQQRAAKQTASSAAHGRSRAGLPHHEPAAQRDAVSADADSSDGAGMGLFDEETGAEWDAPPPAAKAPATAAPQQPGGKARKGVFDPFRIGGTCAELCTR